LQKASNEPSPEAFASSGFSDHRENASLFRSEASRQNQDQHQDDDEAAPAAGATPQKAMTRTSVPPAIRGDT
jgi:hypothetical protein